MNTNVDFDAPLLLYSSFVLTNRQLTAASVLLRDKVVMSHAQASYVLHTRTKRQEKSLCDDVRPKAPWRQMVTVP